MAKSRPGQSTPSSGSAAPSRLPSTRERRPALAALALLLIVGGALGSGWLAVRSGNRAYFLQVSHEVVQGQKITKDDVRSVSLPEDFADGIPAGDKDSIINQYATTRLVEKTVLTHAMLSKTSGVADGKAQFPIQTPATNAVSSLRNGSPVALYVGASDGSKQRGISGQVVQVDTSGGSSSIGAGGDQITLLVSVDISCGPTVAQGLADNQVFPALVGASDKSQSLATTCEG